MMDVALLGRTPRLDDEEDDEVSSADCLRRFEQTESNSIDGDSTMDDGPLAMICERGVCPLNCVEY